MLLKSLKRQKPSELILIMIAFTAIVSHCAYLGYGEFKADRVNQIGFIMPTVIGVFYGYYLIRAVIIFKQKVIG
jgi:uncharacterized membrane protein